MKKIFAAALALFLAAAPATQAGEAYADGGKSPACDCNALCIPLPKLNNFCTREICRRPVTKVKCICGEIVKVHFVQVTYETTDACGKSVTWTKIYRCDGGGGDK